MSNEGDELVEKYINDMNLKVRIASGFPTNKWGVRSYPSAALINPDGEIVWTGHPSEVTGGKIKRVLKGAKARKGDFLSFRVSRELSPKLKSAAASALDGKLGKAYGMTSKIAADVKADASAREDAQVFAGEILDFAAMLSAQADRAITKREIIKGLMVLDALEREFKGTEFGQGVTDRLAEIAKDEELQNELAAEEAWVKALSAIEKRGLKKSASKLEFIVKKFPGTKAAKLAAMKLRKV